MPVVIRRCSNTARFVHWSDDLLTDAEEGAWVPADDAPEGCTVFEVRPLNDAKISSCVETETGSNVRLCKAGVVSVDGAPVTDWSDWSAGWTKDLANLIAQVSESPTVRPRSTSGEGAVQTDTK